MARRALDFALAHPQADAGYTAVVSRLQQEVAQADQASVLQDTGDEREHAAIARRTAVRQEVRTQHLLRLTRLAKRAAKEHPELAGRFTLPPTRGPNRAFLVKATAMLQDATAQKDLLASIGLGDTFIAELTQAVADLDKATADAHAARADHVGAAAQLEQLAALAAVDVSVIDTYVRRIYANDAMALAAWKSARNLAGPYTPGAAATPAVVPAPAPTPTPVAEGPVPGSSETVA